MLNELRAFRSAKMKGGERRSLDEWIALGIAAQGLYHATRNTYSLGKNWYDKRHAVPDEDDFELFTIEINEKNDDQLFRQLMGWMVQHMPTEKRSKIKYTVIDDELKPLPDSLEGKAIECKWNGQIIIGKLMDPSKGATNDEGKVEYPELELDFRGKFIHSRTLLFYTTSEQVRDAFVKWIADEYLQSDDDDDYVYRFTPRVFRSTSSGSWAAVKFLGQRSPDTLFLSDNTYEDMVHDIRRFKDNYQRYMDLGIPWHRGYLLYGPPGTGKTSTICALAHEFEMHVRMLSLTSLTDDQALLAAMNNCEGTIIVLEDVDKALVTNKDRKDDADRKGVTLNGLYQVFDGAMTPDGAIIIMTANNPENLDPTLIRKGRIDRKFEIGYMNQSAFDRMLYRFLGDEAPMIELERTTVAPNEIVECLKQGFDEPIEVTVNCIREVVARDYQPPEFVRKLTFEVDDQEEYEAMAYDPDVDDL